MFLTKKCDQFHAMDTLHKHKYNTADAISSLVPSTGPVLCRDEMEEWSASEANLFEDALEKYGKDFNDIRQDFVSGFDFFSGNKEITVIHFAATMEDFKKYN